MSYTKTFWDFRAEISIIQLALANGYALEKSKGLKWPVLYNEAWDDRVIIVNAASVANQGYWNPRDDKDKGTLITFVRNRLGRVFPGDSLKSDAVNINNVLYGFLKMPLPERPVAVVARQKPVVPFSAEGLRPLRNTGYLRTRGISAETLSCAAFAGRVYNLHAGGYVNTAFPYYAVAQKIVGVEVRNEGFKMFVPGSDRSVGVWFSAIPPKLERVVLCESPIDALSYQQLKRPENALYAAFGGSVAEGQLEAVKQICGDCLFVSAVDNDAVGRRYNKLFERWFPGRVVVDAPEGKDYNEDLDKGACH